MSFSHKYNIANGEENRDGIEHNISWNCGAEGVDSVPPHVIRLRRKQMKNFILALVVSRGMPVSATIKHALLITSRNTNALHGR